MFFGGQVKSEKFSFICHIYFLLDHTGLQSFVNEKKILFPGRLQKTAKFSEKMAKDSVTKQKICYSVKLIEKIIFKNLIN